MVAQKMPSVESVANNFRAWDLSLNWSIIIHKTRWECRAHTMFSSTRWKVVPVYNRILNTANASPFLVLTRKTAVLLKFIFFGVISIQTVSAQKTLPPLGLVDKWDNCFRISWTETTGYWAGIWRVYFYVKQRLPTTGYWVGVWRGTLPRFFACNYIGLNRLM